MKRILILGGGFAGIAAALELRKHKDALKYHITLIDEKNFHLFTPSLYEVATSEEPKKNIAIPYKDIFDHDIEVIVGKVKYIHPNLNRVYLEDTTHYVYDYLILALGSEPAYFNIPGLKHYSLPLKSLSDAVCIKDKIKYTYHEKIKHNDTLHIVIGGGGFSGTELAAELIGYKDHLAHHHKYPNSIDITIIQGSECLLKELDPMVSHVAQKRVMQGGIETVFGNHITHVTHDTITTDTGMRIPYDIFIWTGGIKANSITHSSGLPVNHRGQVLLNDFLQVQNFTNIFACGDIGEYINPLTKKSLPTVAPVAEAEGKAVAGNIYRLLKGLPLLTFHHIHLGYIVPLRGRFAVAQVGKIHITGIFAWIMQQFVFLYYLMNILPLSKAFIKWNIFEKQLEC